MEIKTNKNDGELVIAVIGRLDTTTSPELETKIAEERDGVSKIVFDFADLEYISSAGLRVLLKTAQSLDDMNDMVVKNVSSDIMDIFEVTGFTDILNIE